MASNDSLHVSFDDGLGPIASAWNVDTSTPGEIRLAGNSAVMEYATGPDAGHGYGTYTINAKVDGNQPGPGIIFWPGDNKWPGQELDLVEITPDGSGRQYGTVHWNDGGHDAYEAQIFEGVSGGVFHDYTMVWEPGKITYKVDGVEKAVFTDHVPTDFANGGMNNTIGFLNNNPNTSITVRDVTYTPLGGEAPAVAAAPEDGTSTPQTDIVVPAEAVEQQAATDIVLATGADAGSIVSHGGWDWPADASGNVDWSAVAAQVTANYEATGSWFI
jgi:hypothetical protein